MLDVKYLVEFLGTFVFLYIILESAGYGTLQPLVIAAGLLAAILLFGRVSGGHFNPAVTAMLWSRGDNVEPIGYIVAQVLGGLAAYQAHTMINKA